MKKFALAFALFLAAPVFAQEQVRNDEFSVAAQVPAGWTASDEDDRAVFNLLHEDHSQIEILGNEIVTDEVAELFFSHFHDSLESSDFMRVGGEEKSYGDVSGTETTYRFEHTGTALKITVFQFVRDTTAWLAVGYFREEEADAHATTFRAFVGGLAFDE